MLNGVQNVAHAGVSLLEVISVLGDERAEPAQPYLLNTEPIGLIIQNRVVQALQQTIGARDGLRGLAHQNIDVVARATPECMHQTSLWWEWN